LITLKKITRLIDDWQYIFQRKKLFWTKDCVIKKSTDMKNPLPTLILLLAVFLLWNCQTTNDPASNANVFPVNQEILSEEGEPILVGQLKREAWQMEAYKSWFDYEYEAYEVNEAALSNLKMKGVTFKVFLGTWCSDSQRELPRFYKIADYLDLKENQLQIVGLDNHTDRYKQSPQHEEEGWNIEYVPTIIVLKDGKEVGRIVEMPEVSLEEDLVKILEEKVIL
jgi:thiol-disulfide isomerase/thioredoxin